MIEGIKRIERTAFISDIVKNDYRTAAVFKKYDIDFCCGGKFSIEMICANKNLDTTEVIRELEASIQDTTSTGVYEFQDWKPDFLADYVIHVHHRYLEKAIPDTAAYLDNLTRKHTTQFSYLPELQHTFTAFSDIIVPQQKQEEEAIFPYVRQVARAYQNKESYAALLVRTLRKPVEQVMLQEQKRVEDLIRKMRELTRNYTPPENACVSHKVTLKKLLEVDNDTVQHIHLENDILYPRILSMETELTRQGGYQ
ncbi:MAG: DUF542 domain-containing protein [Chitinophagaceae bacterium]|nr:DUF542 domain-containing protein [Chitinophagaceae bacterium]